MSSTDITQDQRKSFRPFLWVWSLIFSCLLGPGALALFMPGPGATEVLLGLGIVGFVAGFLLGPVAFAFLVTMLGKDMLEMVSVHSGWTPCCTNWDGESGMVKVVSLGPAFVGAALSTYLLVAWLRGKTTSVSRYLVYALLLTLTWQGVQWGVAAICTANFCARQS